MSDVSVTVYVAFWLPFTDCEVGALYAIEKSRTCCVTAGDALVLKLASPLYVAVSDALPADGKVIEQLPEPALSVPVQDWPPPDTVTVPDGPAAPPVNATAETTLKLTVTG